MSIQFQRRYLLEDDAASMVADILRELGASEEAVEMLTKAVNDQLITPEKAIQIVKSTTGISEEGSMTAGAGGFLPSLHASEKDVKGPELEEDAPILAGGKIKDNYAVSHFGYKAVPKGHAKMKGIIVKDLWETTFVQNMYYGVDGKEAMYLGIKDDKYLFRTMDGKRIEIDDPSKVKKLDENLKEIFTKEDQEKAEALLDKIKSTNSKLYRAIVSLVLDEYPHTGDELDALVAGTTELSENYHRFKKETVTRTKAQQMHEAAKAVEKRLKEINRILEYTGRLKSELFEEEGDEDVSHHTKKVMERVTKNIAEAYSKLKKIK